MTFLKKSWMELQSYFNQQKLQHPQLQQYQRQLCAQLALPLSQCQMVALDLEMTGLDPETDQIISIGTVPIENGHIPLNKAQHKMVTIEGSVGDSAAIHGIVDHHLKDALAVEDALLWLLQETNGKVIVAHHAPLDIAFLKAKLTQQFGETIKFAYIDTLVIEKSRWLRQHEVLKEGCLRLGASRERYHLPVYSAHSALIDALACGELLLAQMAAIGNSDKTTVAELAQLL